MITEVNIDALRQFIQSSLTSPDLIDEDLFRDEAVSYNDLCYQLNEHLAETDRLLDLGRRDEAIDYSERNGNLLEAFDKLDLPEKQLWSELVSAFELPPPPALDEAAAEQLNDAYSSVGELTPLLKRHRLLALDRAPLKYRLHTLAELARRDPLNPIWQQGVEEFQKARLHEIPPELAVAMKQQDTQVIDELHQELTTIPWVIPVPAKLKTQVHTAKQACQRRDAISQIKQLADELEQARMADHQSDGIALADEIGGLLAGASLQSDDPVMQSVQQGLAWVHQLHEATERQQRDEQAIANFKRILNTAKTPAKLETAMQSIASMGSRFPGDLRHRGEKRLKAMQQTILLKRLMMIGGSVAVALVVMAGIAGFIFYQKREATLASLDDKFTALVADQRWQDAKAFYESQPESVQLRAAFTAGAIDVSAAIKEGRKQQEAFDKVVVKIEASNSIESKKELLDQLKELANTREQEMILVEQQSLFGREKLIQERSDSEKVSKQLVLIRGDYNRMQRENNPEEAAMATLQRRMNDLAAMAKYCDDRVRDESKELQQLIETLIQDKKSVLLRRKAWGNITASVGDVDSFSQALADYTKGKLANDQKEHWSKLPLMLKKMRDDQAWVAAYNDSAFQDPQSASPEAIEIWLKQINQLAESSARTSHFVQEKIERRTDTIRRKAKQAEAIKTLNAFAGSSLLKISYAYIDQDPNRNLKDEPPAVYYSPKPYDSGDPPHIVNYFVDYSLDERTKNFGQFKYAEMKGLQSGHSMFGTWLRQNISKFQGKNFAPMGVRLLDTLAAMPEDRTDPVFKLSLIRNFMKAMLPASESLQVGYQPILDRLEGSGFDWEANWFHPGQDDSKVEAARVQAGVLLNEITKWKDARERVKKTWKKNNRQTQSQIRWVGWWAPSKLGPLANLQSTGPDETLIVLRHSLDESDSSISVSPIEIGSGGGHSILSFSLKRTGGTTPAVYAVKKDFLP
jgi:hypothetical protein